MNETKIQPLEALSTIMLGATPKAFKRNAPDGEANALLLRGKEFNSLGQFEINEMEPVVVDDAKGRAQRHILQEGDVVLLTRGSAIRAGYVPIEVAEKNVIASVNFIIIRANRDKVLGEVIAAYINSPIGRQALLKHSVGTVVQQVPASELRRFRLPVPSLERQQVIADLYHASINAYRETLALAEQQQRVANAAITMLLQGAS
jgi:restriction endonuclease S subunit